MLGKLFGFFRRSHGENPDEDPRNAVGEHDEESPLNAGQVITAKRALALSAVFRAVSLISGDLMKLPIKVYRRGSDNARERLRDHPVDRLFHALPGREIQPGMVRRSAQAATCLHGNGYVYVLRQRGLPVELILLPHNRGTYPVRDSAGKLWYLVTLPNGQTRKLPPDEVIHIRGFGFDGLEGLSVIRYGAESIGLSAAVQTYGKRFFDNNAHPGGVLTVPAWLGDEERKNLKKSWNSIHRGLKGAHRVALLEGGIKYEPMQVNAKDSQLIERAQFGVRDIANFFGVPPHKLGDPAKQGYNSLEAENTSYLNEALEPWLVTWEEELTAKLLSIDEINAGIYIEFDRSALLRPDLNVRFTAYGQALMAGWITANEVRTRENMPPLPGGDVLRVPLATAPAASGPATPAEGEG